MGDAIWTFGALVDWITAEVPVGNSRQGIVLGGSEGVGRRLVKELGYHPNTASAHLSRLEDQDYIVRVRGQRGYSVRVRNSKKWTRIRNAVNHSNEGSGDTDEPQVTTNRNHSEQDSQETGFTTCCESESQSTVNHSLYNTTETMHISSESVKLVQDLIVTPLSWGRWYRERAKEEADRLGLEELGRFVTENLD